MRCTYTAKRTDVLTPKAIPALQPGLRLEKAKDLGRKQRQKKTYNSGYSPVVTHLTTNPPVHCLSTAERTGSSIFSVLWSYVKERVVQVVNLLSHEMIQNTFAQICACR
jgi:hypothetical protein